MATQTVEFRAATGLTIIAKLFAAGSDTEVASVTATEATNRKGTYRAAYTSVAAGEYQLIAFDSQPIPVASWWVTLESSTATYQTYSKADRLSIADAVWDESYSQHTAAGTFGKLLDTLRKANLVFEGTITSAETPTTTAFTTNISETTGAFNHAVLLFVSGDLNGENGVVDTYVSTNGKITVDEAFTAAPQAGDEFIIVAASHVHPISEIQDALAVTVAPLQATAPNRVAGTQVVTHINDTSDIGPIAVTDSSGDAVDLSAYTLKVCIEQRDGTVLQNATPTVSGTGNNQITWTPNAASVESTGTLRWSLRVVSTGQVLALGDFIIDPAAKIST